MHDLTACSIGGSTSINSNSLMKGGPRRSVHTCTSPTTHLVIATATVSSETYPRQESAGSGGGRDHVSSLTHREPISLPGEAYPWAPPREPVAL